MEPGRSGCSRGWRGPWRSRVAAGARPGLGRGLPQQRERRDDGEEQRRGRGPGPGGQATRPGRDPSRARIRAGQRVEVAARGRRTASSPSPRRPRRTPRAARRIPRRRRRERRPPPSPRRKLAVEIGGEPLVLVAAHGAPAFRRSAAAPRYGRSAWARRSRARNRRDITVPGLIASASAISAYDSSSTARSTSTARWSCGS